MRRALASFALLLVGCGGVRMQPTVIFQFPPPPQQMSVMVKVICDGLWRGWATPYGATTALTVAHVINGCVSIGWESNVRRGNFIILKRASKDNDGVPVSDYALLLSDVNFDSWADISKREPKPGELLFHRLLLPGLVPVDAPSFYLGKDSGGFLESEGTARHGSSGSGLFDASGHLVGTVNGMDGATLGRSLVWSTSTEVVFR